MRGYIEDTEREGPFLPALLLALFSSHFTASSEEYMVGEEERMAHRLTTKDHERYVAIFSLNVPYPSRSLPQRDTSGSKYGRLESFGDAESLYV